MTSKRQSRRKGRLQRWAFKAKAYKSATEIHEFENEVILRKATALKELTGGAFGPQAFTAAALESAFPTLFDTRNLNRALKRMRKDGLLVRGKRWGKTTVYKTKPEEEAQAA